MRLSTLALCASLLQVTLASPLFSPFPVSVPYQTELGRVVKRKDPHSSVPQPSSEPTLLRPNADLAAGLTCPGVSDLTKLKNPILLQPGTGLTAEQSYTYGYVKIASTLGYEPCLVATQHALLNDTQDSVEFLVYAVQQLSRYAPDGKVPLFTWSLGGPLAQWMFTFWPSTRKQVKQLIALAPDFRGANFAKIANNVILGEPSLYQQAPNSTWLKALKSHSGLNGWVPTTVIYSADDEIVQPEDGPEASSVLSDVRSVGVRNVKVQDLCGEKFSMHVRVLRLCKEKKMSC